MALLRRKGNDIKLLSQLQSFNHHYITNAQTRNGWWCTFKQTEDP